MSKYCEFTKIAALYLKSLLNRNQEFNDFLKNASEYEDSSRYTREKQFSSILDVIRVYSRCILKYICVFFLFEYSRID
ncbi:hypothetical protein BpHYR1_027913 [Brachionus plicatilis]|uniref:Uncharacterized protein n=1 Tax=Brachionus plicatilis TaxID=10195 RepID=A0A3M7SC69_BRAPC|nr:hypothetical protein BpHYR1_027913 [Brachionus plicatilis]